MLDFRKSASESSMGLISALCSRKEDWQSWEIEDVQRFQISKSSEDAEPQIKLDSSWVQARLHTPESLQQIRFRGMLGAQDALDKLFSAPKLSPQKTETSPPDALPKNAPIEKIHKILNSATYTGTLEVKHLFSHQSEPRIIIHYTAR